MYTAYIMHISIYKKGHNSDLHLVLDQHRWDVFSACCDDELLDATGDLHKAYSM